MKQCKHFDKDVAQKSPKYIEHLLYIFFDPASLFLLLSFSTSFSLVLSKQRINFWQMDQKQNQFEKWNMTGVNIYKVHNTNRVTLVGLQRLN